MTSRYEPLLLLGTGGMASVHVGRLRGADGSSRLVALKRAHAHVKEDVSLANGMRNEARLASRLHHPNVVSVLDVEEDEGDLVLVLDYVEGCTLASLLAKMPAPRGRPREMVRVILDIAAGLHAAHQATDEDGHLLGVVHRDVSPSNVLLGTDGVARVSDFGIAKAQFAERERTETGLLKGKASYMAPEYVLHQRASPASDLFSLGIVAWEALTGTRLFKGATEIDTLERIVSATVHPMAEHDRALAPLDPVVLRALSRLPEDRQTSVDELAAELAAVARRHDLLGSHHEVSALIEAVAGAALAERRRELARTIDRTTMAVVAPASVHAPVGAGTLPKIEVVVPATFRQDDKPAATGREKLGLLGALVLLVFALLFLAMRMREGDGATPVVPTATGAASAAPSMSAAPEEPSATPVTDETPAPEVDASTPKSSVRPAHKRTPPALGPRRPPPDPNASAPR